MTISTNFESGSARVLAMDDQAQTIRISPGGDVKRGMPNWWYFRLDGIDTTKPVVVDVVALKPPTAEGENSETKSAPLNPNWTLPMRAAISADGTTWSQTSLGKRQNDHSVYTLKVSSPTIWLAWGPPFTPHDATVLVDGLAHDHSFVKTFQLATSLEGRSIPAFRVYEGDKALSNRPVIYVIARQHAWEVGGSWVAKGFAEWVVGDSDEAKWLRQNGEITVVPLMDVDHVATGDGGKQALPQDQNRDWSESPHWPEVAAVQKQIRAIAAEKRMAIFLDLHNPSPGETLPKFYRQFPPYASESVSAHEDRFLAVATNVFGQIKVIDGKPTRPQDEQVWHRLSEPWVGEHGNPQTVSFTFEIPWNNPNGTVQGYADIGRKVGLSIVTYLRDPANNP
ncbi:MAG TPA: M14-type cytosolic carboxypeptidase [Desulfuromonadaceae bacterium]|nr:M14-type cytosolic carboxypeptidase [Desulfuromonadaceae bacterium]